jgi:trehalose 6-phosphate synthase
VHDYHLLPLALHLRRLGIEVPIGFFLHIPFPPPQVFIAVPEHVRLAEALASYDLVGLQTSLDVANLITFMRLAATGQLLQDGRLRAFNRIVGLRSFPVGIDPAPMLPPDLDEPEPSARPRRQIVGVDRLDYSKGLPEKFRAFGRFLQRYAQYRGNVVLLQIASPTRESVEAYADIRQQLEGLAGSINGRHGELDWVPINYINRAVPRQELPEVYRNSIVGLVTPLCDGMNLVAKEYVAAQRSSDPGVLILSRFAGAAEQLQEALIVNPYNAEEVAQAIDRALQMPRWERCERHAALLSKVRRESARHWASSFLETLRAHANARSPRDRDESLAFHMPTIADASRSEDLLERLNT